MSEGFFFQKKTEYSHFLQNSLCIYTRAPKEKKNKSASKRQINYWNLHQFSINILAEFALKSVGESIIRVF